MNPADFAKLVEGLSQDEIISLAIDCGYLENKDIARGDEVTVPRWLADILAKHGIVEHVEAYEER